MQHFFVSPSQVLGEEIEICGSDVNHMKNVLRMKIGEEVSVSDGDGTHYLCHIKGYEGDSAFLTVDEKESSNTELPSEIVLYQGLPKQDKMELIVQKAVELGASRVVPVVMNRCVVKLDEKKAKKKKERWQQIAESAAKQAKRSVIPEVSDVMPYKLALKEASELDHVLLPFEHAEGMAHTKEVLKGIKPGQSIGIFIGPEGGFEDDEVEKAMESGAEVVTLGKRILRTETAGFTILSVLMFQLEE